MMLDVPLASPSRRGIAPAQHHRAGLERAKLLQEGLDAVRAEGVVAASGSGSSDGEASAMWFRGVEALKTRIPRLAVKKAGKDRRRRRPLLR